MSVMLFMIAIYNPSKDVIITPMADKDKIVTITPPPIFGVPALKI
ncbi:hypothetical protein NO1_1930 [Candidatus Termititenax aidoneus]|uniref:Uncharacterized protein n=1 Tax=Termititenax aidoneus TaxID=2218524 RepID=A0A388TE95_TERA1|nr:hypothetical protein NO1_1930 [Candidatus Termititenax aidoneus]